MKQLLATITFLVDTREQQNSYILQYFEATNTPYIPQKLDIGDYAAFLPRNDEFAIPRNLYFPFAIERKNSIDELAQSIKHERFENELIRSQKVHFTLLIEDSYFNLVNGNYRSQYNPKSLLARLKSFEARYGFSTIFLPEKELIGHWIIHHLHYHVRTFLKG